MNRVPPTRHLSRSPIFYKKIFPAIWSGAILLMAIMFVLETETKDRAWGLVYLAAIGLFGLGFVIAMTGGMVDEVLDGGDYLRIRRGKVTHDVPLRFIEKVNEPWFNKRPPQIELVMKTSGPFGRVITFYPVDYSWLPFVEGALTKELRERVQRAGHEDAQNRRP
ncbi:MAG TPA: hypothetical protein VK474_11790 [Chthoniobacterales bacterium]|nr:hypothetical protein [Chthoniobacterales bacterium]